VIQVMEGGIASATSRSRRTCSPAPITRRQRAEIGRPRARLRLLPAPEAAAPSQAGYTSGGEQQMTAIGRALMARPTMILLDEPSMGLAPQIVEEIFEIVQTSTRRSA
jgi:branched-chain amino acid transport system ATP-binding protein